MAVCAIVLRVLDPPTEADLELLRCFESEHPVRFYLQPGGVDSVRPLQPGAPPLVYALASFGLQLEFEPTDFIQVNGELNERMVGRAVELLALEPGHAVLDLFCGLGNFSLPLATRAREVVGIEGDAGLVARAARNAARNALANATFHAADLFADTSGAPWARRRYDRVLLDPPRAGAREVLPVVGALRRGARRVYFLSPGQPGSRRRAPGPGARLPPGGGGCDGHVPAHDPCRGRGGLRTLTRCRLEEAT